MVMLLPILLCLSSYVAFGAPSWPTMFSYSPDTLPIIDVRLAPPHKQMPEVSAALSQLDAARVAFESDRMREVEEAYNTSLREGAEKITSAIDRLMQKFQNPAAMVSHRYRLQKWRNGQGAQSPSLREARRDPGGHELTARINLLPIASPDASLEQHIKAIERKRSRDEGSLFKQAVSEMNALTEVVQNEVEAQVLRHANNFLHTAQYSLDARPHAFLHKTVSAGLLSAGQPVGASGLQLTTNVRVAASEEPFHTVSALVEDMERRRDASEELIRKRVLELELKLLQAENDLIAHHVEGWVARISSASA